MRVERHKGTRLALQGDRVDCNAIRKMQKMQDLDAGIGAFGGRKNLVRDNRPMKPHDPVAAEKTRLLKEKEEDKFKSFIGSRAMKFKPTNAGPLNNKLKISEVAKVDQSSYETKKNLLNNKTVAPMFQVPDKRPMQVPCFEAEEELEIDFGTSMAAPVALPQVNKKTSMNTFFQRQNQMSVTNTLLKRRKV